MLIGLTIAGVFEMVQNDQRRERHQGGDKKGGGSRSRCRQAFKQDTKALAMMFT